MKPVGIMRTGALLLLLGSPAPGWALEEKPQDQGNADKQGQDKGKGKKAKPQNKGQEQKAARDEQRARQRQEQEQANQHRQAQQQLARLSQERQQQLITQQQRRVIEYRQHLGQRQHLAQQYAARLQQQNRTANYRVQQDYLARVQQQQLALQSSYDYNNDPYFYTASQYRYRRDGSYYETNEYGANMLRQSINTGYDEGYRAGQADREDRWASDYKNSYAYQDANYGYSGYNVNQADYNYYFRQGFDRGYQDGYNRRSQFGQELNGSRNILGAILSQILNLQSLR